MKSLESSVRTLILFVAAIFLVSMPLLIENYWLHYLNLSIIFAMVTSSWNVTIGFGKIFNFAHPVFFGVGSYTYAILTTRFGLFTPLSIFLGGVLASIASGLVYAPVAKVRGIYVSLITFAVSQLFIVLIISQGDFTGGTSGLVGVPSLSIGKYSVESKASFYFVALIALVFSTLAMRWYVRSKFGLALIASSVYEDYAQSRGVSIGQTRLVSFLISSFPAGIAGGLYSSYLTMASIEIVSFSFATVLLTMVLVGGTGSIYGPILGAVSLIALTESLSGIGLIRFILVAVLMAGTVLLAPKGLWGGLIYVLSKLGLKKI